MSSKAVFYSEKGIVEEQFSYLDGRKTGFRRHFFDSGELSWEITYKDDFITKANQYYKGGNLAGEIDFKNGKAVKGTKYTVEGDASPMTNAHFHNKGFEY